MTRELLGLLSTICSPWLVLLYIYCNTLCIKMLQKLQNAQVFIFTRDLRFLAKGCEMNGF